MVDFHPMKVQPDRQMEAHHYCHQVKEDFAQCTLFDSNGKNTKLNGIGYIISEKLFEGLPEEERKYWHPHNGEILSGQLVAPNIPAAAEKSLMESKMNSYEKTWHVWNTGHEGMTGDKVPMGLSQLAWSFNRDGEAKPGLVEKCDRHMGIDSTEKRRQRAPLQKLATSQSGVDDLKGKFGRHTWEIPGVVDRKSASMPAGQGSAPVSVAPASAAPAK